MKRLRIRVASAAFAVVIGLLGITGCGSKTLDGTKTVATVNQNKIPLGVASFALRYTQAQTEYYYASFSAAYGTDTATNIWDKKNEDGVSHGEETKNDVMDRLKKMYLVRDHAEEYGVKVTDEEKQSIADTAKTFIESNEESLLKQIGVTQADIEEYLELQTYYSKAAKPFIADVEIEITDSEAAQSTLTYSFLTTKDMEAEAKEAVKEKMQTLLEEYKANEDIASLDMKAVTEEKDDGFITTTTSFGEDEDTLDEAVREAAKGLTDGQLYDGVIEGSAGYFVVRMDKVLDEEATETKRESIKSEKQKEAFEELVQGWLDDAKDSLEKSIWKKVTLTDKESYVMKKAEAEDTGAETGNETSQDADLVPEEAEDQAAGEEAVPEATPEVNEEEAK